jgi:F0F1-type ATP synthase membrane subunit b/b'
VQIRHIEKGKVNKDKGIKTKITAATRKLQQANRVGASTSTKLEKATKNVGNEII